MVSKHNNIKVIYNPHAGKKRLHIHSADERLKRINSLLKQYQIEYDFSSTKGPGDATKLAKKAIEDGYKIVLAAGGDGTVSEIANALVGSDVTLGIIPAGSSMNICRMLSIPTDLEAAIALLKINRTRKIDLGAVTKIDGDKMDKPYYFIESAGIGLDAEMQEAFKEFEKGHKFSIFKVLGIYLTFISKPVRVLVDGEEHTFLSSLLTISNGPYTGLALHIAPKAKLNDHKLTLSQYQMTRLQLLLHFFKQKIHYERYTSRIKVLQADEIKILSVGRSVHADAAIFGVSPVSFKIVSNAVEVICGFPKQDSVQSLEKRTPRDPKGR